MESERSIVDFERPPLIETVLGVQFDPLPRLTTAHLGAFWHVLGPQEWPNVVDAPSLQQQFERFGDDNAWVEPELRLRLSPKAEVRLQIRNADNDRMIQVQNGRFHLNWLGRQGREYPRYSSVKPHSLEMLGRFLDYVEKAGVGEFRPNQWEVTYVNHLVRGSDWEVPSDWSRIFPGLNLFGDEAESLGTEGFDFDWHYEIKDRLGRLHVELKSGAQRVDGEHRESLRLALTARGPMPPSDNDLDSLSQGLDTGRGAIVTTFTTITSPHAQRGWGRRES